MKRINLLSVLIFILLIGSVNLYAQDWPQFRGPARDGKVTGFKAPAKWPGELSQQWKISVGTGDATPVLAGNRIYLNTRQGDEEVILCLDAKTGKEVWKNSYPCPAVTGPSASQHPGPRSTPAYSNGRIVTFGVTGIISCLDATNGMVLWRKENPANAIPTFYTGMSPLINDGICYFHVGKKDDGQVVACDLNTGTEKWKWSGDGPSYSSPSIMTAGGKKLLIVITEKNLIALDISDGKLLLQVAAPVQQRFYNCVSPYIDGQTIVYSGQGTGTKAIKIEKQGNEFKATELWANTETGAKWNTPILKDGFLYGFSDQKRLYCLDYKTGRTAWIDNAVNSDFSTIVDCGSVIIGLTSTENLLVIKPDGKEYTQLAKYKVADTPIYSYPVIAGNSIYIKDADSLILYKVD